MVAIIDYGMGNVASIKKALKKLNYDCVITHQEDEIQNAHYIIIPGVGSFAVAMQNIRSRGLFDILINEVMIKKKPVLGICLGMQLLASKGFEDGISEGLGFIEGNVIKIPNGNLPVPHMGWNEIDLAENPFFAHVKDFNFYFVHSYFFDVGDQVYRIGTVQYGSPLTAMVWKDNIVGTQFHPEKSQDSGLHVLNNFLTYYA